MDFLLFAALVVAAIFLIRQLQKDLKKATEKAERRRREKLDLEADQAERRRPRRQEELELEAGKALENSRKEINEEVLAFAKSIDTKHYKDGYTGPFGLRAGQPKAHIREDTAERPDLGELEGKAAYILPPKPFALFQSYLGYFDCNSKLSGVAATRKNISKDYNSLIYEMRAAFEVISKMTANKYGNGSINLFDTFEFYQEENPGTSNGYFNMSVANGETTIQGHIEPADEFANRQRFEAEDLKLILLEVGGAKLRLDSGNLYIATLTLYFAFNNHPDNLREGNNDECSEDAEGRIGLLNDSF